MGFFLSLSVGSSLFVVDIIMFLRTLLKLFVTKLPSLTGWVWTALRNEKMLHPRGGFSKYVFKNIIEIIYN